MVASHARLHVRIPAVAELHPFVLCARRSGSTADESGGATSQLDLPSLTSWSVAGCGRLQLGVPHLATTVDYCKKFNSIQFNSISFIEKGTLQRTSKYSYSYT